MAEPRNTLFERFCAASPAEPLVQLPWGGCRVERPHLRLVASSEADRSDSNAEAVQALVAHMDSAVAGLPEFDQGMAVAMATIIWLEGPCGGLTRAVALLADIAASLDRPDDDPDGGLELGVAA